MVPLHLHDVVKGLRQHALLDLTLFVNIKISIIKWCALQIWIQSQYKQNALANFSGLLE